MSGLETGSWGGGGTLAVNRHVQSSPVLTLLGPLCVMTSPHLRTVPPGFSRVSFPAETPRGGLAWWTTAPEPVAGLGAITVLISLPSPAPILHSPRRYAWPVRTAYLLGQTQATPLSPWSLCTSQAVCATLVCLSSKFARGLPIDTSTDLPGGPPLTRGTTATLPPLMTHRYPARTLFHAWQDPGKTS